MSSHNPEEPLRQFHENQSWWVARLSTGLLQPWQQHTNILQVGGTLAVRPGAAGVIMLPMGEDEESALAGHDRALEWLRQYRARDVLVWSMKPNRELDLALLASGYSSGFEPWWMGQALTAEIAEPRHLVRPVTEQDIQQLVRSDIPYVIRDQVAANRSLISAPGTPQVSWLAALEGDEVVGHAIVNVVGGHAGLFNVGVDGTRRHRGIGTSLTLAAMQAARDMGANTMNLNSTPVGKPLYERTGFSQFGVGQTWVRTGRQVHDIPDAAEQALVLAIGRGDIANIRLDPSRHSRLQCGKSPQELAAHFGQGESLLEIIRQGFVPDIIALWRAGLRDEALEAVQDPVARELITGTQRARPVHHAVEMGAGTLVLALIRAGADLNARDGEYQATPLDWAHACNRPTIARILGQSDGR